MDWQGRIRPGGARVFLAGIEMGILQVRFSDAGSRGKGREGKGRGPRAPPPLPSTRAVTVVRPPLLPFLFAPFALTLAPSRPPPPPPPPLLRPQFVAVRSAAALLALALQLAGSGARERGHYGYGPFYPFAVRSLVDAVVVGSSLWDAGVWFGFAEWGAQKRGGEEGEEGRGERD